MIVDKMMSANGLKDQGNKYFYQRKYDDAIICYTQAIAENPNVAVYYSNRALCYIKMKKWDLACQDAKAAIELDPLLIKGHFFLGQALLELEQYDDAIKQFQQASEVAKVQKAQVGDDIACQLRIARKCRWNLMEEKRMQQEIELQSYLNRLIIDDKDRQIEEVTKGKAYEEVEEEIAKIEAFCDNTIAELNNIFAKVDERRRKREVPDHLCGKISFEILRDPVITPSGITYDRKYIEEHLQRVGHFDPVSRTDLTQDQLIPNLSMKEVVDAFLGENGWAIDF